MLLGLVARGDSATITHLDGTILVADGDRVRGDNTTAWGNASSLGQGIGQFYPAISGTANRKLPPYLEDRVHGVCNRLDPVCDDIIPPGADLLPRVKIHLGYTNTRPLRDAVDTVADEVRTTPAPSAGLTSLTAKVGRPYRARLTADIDPDFALQWRLVSPPGLPVGWTMDRSGLVSGTTAYTGTWSARVEVRGVILGVTSDWVPATVRWTISR